MTFKEPALLTEAQKARIKASIGSRKNGALACFIATGIALLKNNSPHISHDGAYLTAGIAAIFLVAAIVLARGAEKCRSRLTTDRLWREHYEKRGYGPNAHPSS